MHDDKVEAVAIATMIAVDQNRIVGWVYRWNTGALAVRWDARGPQRVSRLCPDLCEAEKAEIDFEALTRLPCRNE